MTASAARREIRGRPARRLAGGENTQFSFNARLSAPGTLDGAGFGAGADQLLECVIARGATIFVDGHILASWTSYTATGAAAPDTDRIRLVDLGGV